MKKSFNILVGGEKGGTGKSTIALNIATMFTLAGYDTHLIDCDKQNTSLKFASRRAHLGIKPNLICTHLSGDQLHVPLVDLSNKYDVVIVDCGGQDSIELRSAMITPSINLMLVPIQAGYFDLETLVNVDNLVKTSKIYNTNLTAKCIINRSPTNKQITVTKEARDFISNDLDNLDILDTVVHDRVSYSYSVAKGESVIEYETRNKRDGKASQEMCSLYKEISGGEFEISKKLQMEEVI